MSHETRRKHPRVVVRYPVCINKDNRKFILETEDLSLSGMFVSTNDGWSPGTMLSLSLAHSDDTATAMARVARTFSEGVGLEFLEPPKDFVRIVARILGDQLDGGQPFLDRRRSTRVIGRIVLLLEDGTAYRPLFTSNISESGAFVGDVRQDLAKDPWSLILSEHGIFHIRARVAREDSAGVGIEFLDRGREMSAALGRIIDHFRRLEKEPVII